jgi:membrane fusion protein, multidrug efflux system
MQPQAILVPQIGVARDPKGRPTALVVNAANEVELRVLQTDRAIGDQWLIRHGVKAGDRVIVEGVQKVRPGTPVRAVAAASAATPSVSSAPSAPAAR